MTKEFLHYDDTNINKLYRKETNMFYKIWKVHFKVTFIEEFYVHDQILSD